MRSHIWIRYRDGETHYWCGLVREGVQPEDQITQYSKPEQATCLHCLTALRDASMRRAARDAEIARDTTERIEQLRRAARRKKVRVQSPEGEEG